MVIFALLERRQRRSLDLDQRPAQAFGGGAVADAGEARDRPVGAVADALQLALDAADQQPAVAADAGGAVGEQLQAHLALDAVRAGDRRQGDECGVAQRGL